MTGRLQRQSENLKKDFNELLGEEKTNWDQDQKHANDQYVYGNEQYGNSMETVWKKCLLYNEINFLIKYGIFDSYIYGFLKTTKNSIDRLVYIINNELLPTFGKSYNYDRTIVLLDDFVTRCIIDFL